MLANFLRDRFHPLGITADRFENDCERFYQAYSLFFAVGDGHQEQIAHANTECMHQFGTITFRECPHFVRIGKQVNECLGISMVALVVSDRNPFSRSQIYEPSCLKIPMRLTTRARRLGFSESVAILIQSALK